MPIIDRCPSEQSQIRSLPDTHKVHLIQLRGENLFSHFVRLSADKRYPQSGKHGDQRLGNLVGIEDRAI